MYFDIILPNSMLLIKGNLIPENPPTNPPLSQVFLDDYRSQANHGNPTVAGITCVTLGSQELLLGGYVTAAWLASATRCLFNDRWAGARHFLEHLH